ncbi:MAG: CynX/NimT family MFS transporter [Actinomycetes bacterium]
MSPSSDPAQHAHTRPDAARDPGSGDRGSSAPGSRAAAPPVSPVLLIVGLFLVALNLRAAMASVPPVLSAIEAEVGLGGFGAGLLTALPVLCMSVFAPTAHRLAHRIGREAAVAVALTVLGIGLGARLAGAHVVPLFGGTLLAGFGIAVLGVVLPGIVREFFPHHPGAATGAYVTGLAFGASVAAAFAVPLEECLGSWQASLATWAGLALVAGAAWMPVVLRANEHESAEESHRGRLPWRSATAWLVSLYLGVQSFLFYSELAWIAPAYESAGWDPGDAGLLLSAFMLIQLVAGLGVPALADLTPDRRPWFLLVVACILLGLLAMLAWPETMPWLFVAVLGFGQGGAFAMGLLLLVDHARTPEDSGRLSAMAFLVSYLVAACGPAVVGGLRDATDGFDVPWAVLLVLAVVQVPLVVQFSPARRARGI